MGEIRKISLVVADVDGTVVTHIASLLPGNKLLEKRNRWVAAVAHGRRPPDHWAGHMIAVNGDTARSGRFLHKETRR